MLLKHKLVIRLLKLQIDLVLIVGLHLSLSLGLMQRYSQLNLIYYWLPLPCLDWHRLTDYVWRCLHYLGGYFIWLLKILHKIVFSWDFQLHLKISTVHYLIGRFFYCKILLLRGISCRICNWVRSHCVGQDLHFISVIYIYQMVMNQIVVRAILVIKLLNMIENFSDIFDVSSCTDPKFFARILKAFSFDVLDLWYCVVSLFTPFQLLI